MRKNKFSIWNKCINCKTNCCKTYFSFSVFLTPQEKTFLNKMNCSFPCTYLDKNGLCEIHKKRSLDCKLFPFDIKLVNGEFFWKIWEADCPIAKKSGNYESILRDFEKTIIPKLKECLNEYEQFRLKELESKYKYRILRKVKIN